MGLGRAGRTRALGGGGFDQGTALLHRGGGGLTRGQRQAVIGRSALYKGASVALVWRERGGTASRGKRARARDRCSPPQRAGKEDRDTTESPREIHQRPETIPRAL